MSNTVTINELSAFEALGFKYELEQAGLKYNRDYTWRYQPVKYNDGWSNEPMHKSQVVFDFANPSLASFYRIKWAR